MQLTSQFRIVRAIAPIAIVMLALTGCGPNVDPTAGPNPTGTTQPTGEPTDPPVQTEFFSMPADCTGILPATDVAAFAADGVILLAGPGGKYGNELITEPTPEMSAGGISCYFGVDNEDLTLLRVNVLVSAVPLDDTSRAKVIDDLAAQGLARAMDERGDVTFGILGVSEGQTTANYNVIASDSWISVLSSDGGEAAFLAIVSLANAVHIANYN
ncbi:unannotated protein [freshwater metagenome]|uniref:Unannotated protein n=1 Tax=freshwater metagenome TaxID=449393 RepID=A0A6J6BQI9_9ZZZZ|nr:hypothetical protein [Actinomycetota bacterium]MTA05935.1 hypothetical protein [Actinomycetota bacterium]MTA37925.1 hypothetical protein [Actinomycetota bacterium]